MANIPIRDIPGAVQTAPSPNALLAMDNGTSMEKTTVQAITDSGAPVASKSEAEAGTDNTKRMTALRVKESIAAEVGQTIASSAQGDKADSAVQPSRTISAGTGLVGGGDLSANRSFALSTTALASLALADTAVQPARAITAGAGLTGGGDLSADRTISLSTATQASLALADNAVQPTITISAGTGLTGGGTLEADRSIALSSASIASLAKADSSVQTVNGNAPDGAGNVVVDAEFTQEQDSRAKATLATFAPTVGWVRTAGYSSAGDGGGALYKRASSEPSHPGKFQSADGAWWEIAEATPNALMFGAKPDCDPATYTGTDNTAALQSFLDYCYSHGKQWRIPAGRYYCAGPLSATQNTSSSSWYSDYRASLIGEGVRLSQLYFGPGEFDCITLTGGKENDTNFSFQSVDGLAIKKADHGGDGLVLDAHFHAHLSDIHVMGCEVGVRFTDVHETLMTNVVLSWNDAGMRATKDTFTQPNIILLNNCTIGNNSNYGLDIAEAVTFTMVGGSIEGNGITGTSPTKWGIRAIYNSSTSQTEGSVGLNLIGVYIEANKCDADVWIVNEDKVDLVTNIQGCSFQRTSSVNYSQNCVRVDWSGSTYKNILNLFGNGFRHFNDYVPNASRPYVNLTGTPGDLFEVNCLGNLFASPLENPQLSLSWRGLSKPLMNSAYAEVLADGTVSKARNVASVTKPATGTYVLNFKSELDSVAFSASPVAIGDGPVVFRIIAFSATSLTIEARNPATNDLQDCRFGVAVTGGLDD